jgi:hypothetical protein
LIKLGLVLFKSSKNKYLTFQEIDERLLKILKIYLKGTCSLSETSGNECYGILVRIIFNRAIKDKVVNKKYIFLELVSSK